MKPEVVTSIYEKYPKAVAAVQQYLIGVYMKAPDVELPMFKKLAEQVTNQIVESTKTFMITGDRFLYEFFDDRGIHVWVLIQDNNMYSPKVTVGNKNSHLKVQSSRKEAESVGFEMAFDILEQML